MERALPADWMDRLARLECVALDADHQALDAETVRRAHAGGYRVVCWTANESDRIATLAAWGVDGIITDSVDHVPADSLPPPPPLS
jgi:glycerophosphoryl diester phosphodiesterase